MADTLLAERHHCCLSVQSVEGIFFMVGSMAECVDLEETLHLPVLMNMVPSVHFTNITLLSTALYMIGRYYCPFQQHYSDLNCAAHDR